MTDETTSAVENEPTTEETAAENTEAVDAGAEGAEGAEQTKEKLTQTVDIKDVGPCKKHFKVTIERNDVDRLLNERYAKLVGDSMVPGFRPGKAPREIVVRKFQKDVHREVRSQLLMASLEQLGEDFEVAPLSPPNINPDRLEIPKDGPFIYEFSVEVRPEFDLPDYKGLKLKRPAHEYSEEEVEKEEKRLLSRYGQLIPKPEGKADFGDFVVADITSTFEGKELGSAKEAVIRVESSVAFKDGVATDFGEQVVGASGGDKRTIHIEMTDAVADENLMGKTVEATLEVKEVKTLRLPELTHEFLHNFGVHNPEQLREKVRTSLERQWQYHQNQSIRKQILEYISAAATWELPRDLLMRQASRALDRRIMEMREAGIGDEEIKARQRVLERDVLSNTATTLKEHFVLQKIAEVEKIEVNDDEIDAEIEVLAAMHNESPRRLRAQLEREDQLETLAIHIIERRVLELIMENAEIEEVADQPAKAIGSSDHQTVEGEMKDPTAAPPEEPEETPTSGSEESQG